MIDELYLEARMREMDAEIARSRLVRAARQAGAVRQGAVRHGAPAGRRTQRLLAELYGVGETPDADPALFSRLAWSGADE